MYSNTKNATAQSLLRHDKTVLLGCHIFYGMDFCAPYGIEYIKGRYTVNKVLKIAEKGGFTGGGRHNGILFILTRNAPEKSFSQVFILGRDWFYFPDDFSQFLGKIERFSFKKDFEACRKSDTVETYILWQNEEFLRKPKKKSENGIDISARYRLLNVDKNFPSYMNKPQIDGVTVERIGGCDEKIWYCAQMQYIRGKYDFPRSVDDVIDKSGYFVRERREDLQRRASALRAQKEKAAFEMTDNTEKVSDIADRIEEKKCDLQRMLKYAKYPQELQAISDAMGREGLSRIIDRFENFKDKITRKDFPSIAACESDYRGIISAVENLNPLY